MKAPLLAGLLATAFFATALSSRWNPSWDSAVYLELAHSIAEGEGYSYQGYDFDKFPPGLPVLLAAARCVGGPGELAPRILIVLAGGLAAALAYSLFRRRFTVVTAASATLVMVVSLPFLRETSLVLSDVPFVAAALAVLLCGEDLLKKPGARCAACCAAMVIIATTLRLAGATFGLALALALLMQRRWSAAAFLAAASVAFPLFWILRSAHLAHPLPAGLPEISSYLAEIRSADFRSLDAPLASAADLLDRVSTNLVFYRDGLAAFFGVDNSFGSILGPLLVCWCLYGAFLLTRRHGPLDLIAMLFAAGLYLVWPALELRFLIPLWPLAIQYAIAPLVENRKGRIALLFLGIILVLLHARADLGFFRSEHDDARAKGHLADELTAIAWMKDHLDPAAVIIADRGPIAAHLTGRKSFAFPRTSDSSRILATMNSLGATHVLMNEREHAVRYMAGVIRTSPTSFDEVFRLRAQVVYALKPTGSK